MVEDGTCGMLEDPIANDANAQRDFGAVAASWAEWISAARSMCECVVAK